MTSNYDDVRGISKVTEEAEKLKLLFLLVNYNQLSINSYAELLALLMKDTSKSTSVINKLMKLWILGALRLTKLVGHINKEAFDHQVNMIRLKRLYNLLGRVGKGFLKSVDFKNHFNVAGTELTKFKGMFLGSFKAISSLQIGVARNISQLGRSGFDNLTSELRDIDGLIINITTKLQKMATAKLLALMDPKQRRGMILVLQEMLDKMQLRAKLLADSRGSMYDMIQLQNVLNLKLKPYMDGLDNIALGTDKLGLGINKISSGFSDLGILIVGLSLFTGKMNMDKPVEKLKKIVSLRTFQEVLSLKNVKKEGVINFKALGKSILYIMGSVAKAMKVLFIGAIAGIALGIVAMLTAAFKKAMDYHQLLQQSYINAQRTAGVASGGKGRFGSVYSAMGGALWGGEDANDVYLNMRRYGKLLPTIARNVRQLLRTFSVSTGDAAKLLFNLKEVAGMTLKSAKLFAVRLGKISLHYGYKSADVLSLMANLSLDVMIYFAGVLLKFIRSTFFARKLNLTVLQMARTAEGFRDILSTILKTILLQLMTGKKINTQQLLHYTNSGKILEANALIIDTFIRGNDNLTHNAMLKITLLTGYSASQIKLIQNRLKDSGKSATLILALIGREALESMDPMTLLGKSINGLALAAAPMKTSMDALNTKIKLTFYKAFLPGVNSVQKTLTLGKILLFVEKLATWLGVISNKFIGWITAPGSILKVLKTLSQLWSGIKWSYLNLIVPIAKSFKWAHDKGGIAGVLGLAALYTALLNISTTVKVIKGVWGAGKWLAGGIGSLFKGMLHIEAYTKTKAIAGSLTGMRRVLGGESFTGMTTKGVLTIFKGGMSHSGEFVKLMGIGTKAVGGLVKILGKSKLGASMIAAKGGMAALGLAAGGLAIGLGVVVGAIYLYHRHLQNTSPAGKAKKAMELLVATSKQEIRSYDMKIDILQRHNDRITSSINSYKLLIKNKKRTKLLNDRLKNAYIDILGYEQGIKRFNNNLAISAKLLAKLQLKRMENLEKLKKLLLMRHKSKMAQEIALMRLAVKNMNLKKVQGNWLSRFLTATKAGQFGSQFFNDLKKILLSVILGDTKKAQDLMYKMQGHIKYLELYKNLSILGKSQLQELYNSINMLIDLDLFSQTAGYGKLTSSGLWSVQKVKAKVGNFLPGSVDDLLSQYSFDINKFATGGVVTRPVRALVGESGALAILPLKDDVFSSLALNITDKMLLKGNITAGVGLLTELILRLGNRPILITIQMDSKRVGKVIANNALFTPGIA